MKVKLGISASERDDTLTHVDMVALSTEIAELKDNIVTVSGEIDELDQVICNLQLVRDAVSTNKSPMDAMKMLDCVASVESLLGVAADKITKTVAMEGLGDAIKNTFKKLVEAIKKFFRWIAELFKKNTSSVSAVTKKSEAQSSDTGAAIAKAEDEFESIKDNKQKIDELKANTPEKPSTPEPPADGSIATTTRPKISGPDQLLLTYDPNPENRVICVADFNEWIRYFDKLADVQTKITDFIDACVHRKQKTSAEIIKEIQDLTKRLFGEGLVVGDGNTNAVLIGIIAINDSGKLFPNQKRGTIRTLNWSKRSPDAFKQSINKLQTSAVKCDMSSSGWLTTLRNDIAQYESALAAGGSENYQFTQDELIKLKAKRSYVGTVCRMAGSFNSLVARSCAFYNNDCKIVKAAMDW